MKDLLDRSRTRAERRRRDEYLGHVLSRGLFSQDDLVVANASGATVRADINSQLQALGSRMSGTSAPGTTYAHMLWVDTTNNVVKRRNAANTGWIAVETSSETFVVSRSSNTILGVSDMGKAFVATAGFTQTFTAAATLGDGWWCAYRVASGAAVVFDPNSSENVDGATTKTITGPAEGLVYCDGSAFYTYGFRGASDLLFLDATYDIGKSGATRPRDGFFSRNFAIGGTLGVTGVTTLTAGALSGPSGSFTVQSISSINCLSDSTQSNAALNLRQSNATNQFGIFMNYSAATPNDAGHAFAWFEDASAVRFKVLSNGGVANFSGNDVNLSDERVKPVVESLAAAPGLLDALWAAFASIDWSRFKYADQTHDDWNYGYTAQEIRDRFKDVVPALVETWDLAPMRLKHATQRVKRTFQQVVVRAGKCVLVKEEIEIDEPLFDALPIEDEDGNPVMVETSPGEMKQAQQLVPRMRESTDSELLAVYHEDLKNIALALQAYAMRRIEALEAR